MTTVFPRLILAAVACLGACTAGTTSAPPPPGTDAQPHDGAESLTPTSPPPRTHTVSLQGVDPCELLTTHEAAALLGAPESDLAPEAHQSHHFGEPACRYQADRREIDVETITTAGVHNAAIRPRWTQTVETAPIHGFPALLLIDALPARRCSVAVDVADEQHVLVRLGSEEPDERSTDLCGHARTAAQLAMIHLSS